MLRLAPLGLLFCLLRVENGNGERKFIGVNNGGDLGYWSSAEFCPGALKARGFSLKVERRQKIGDDTALNGIKLFCGKDGSYSQDISITSAEGRHFIVRVSVLHSERGGAFSGRSLRWGKWTEPKWCSHGFLTQFALKHEDNFLVNDYTAANNILFRCSKGSELEGDGESWGAYGDWSATCAAGFSGIQTRVEEDQGKFNDDTSLNDVMFSC
ncbi:vitelline membrane outer layer protein 1 homolog [Xenopus tropicalis]|uniref:Vitelline membrane outer layer protein 1 homolog n=1 Tax=Xenopus tropicalis TaxID=8364 RepID=A0A8J1JAX7_XENTR|nr:vitelline membrane outer layer protein 1 homolog [Xenopus tropicalis]